MLRERLSFWYLLLLPNSGQGLCDFIMVQIMTPESFRIQQVSGAEILKITRHNIGIFAIKIVSSHMLRERQSFWYLLLLPNSGQGLCEFIMVQKMTPESFRIQQVSGAEILKKTRHNIGIVVIYTF